VSCLVQGEVDERGRDGVALLQQDVGELHHGDEEARVQDDRRLHGLCFFFLAASLGSMLASSICTICSTARGFRGEEDL